MKIIIETKRLIIRETTLDDFDNLKEIISNPITMKFYPKPYDDNGVNRWLNWCINSYKENGFGLWAVCLKSTGEYIGDCGISLQNIDGEIVPEVGYHENPKYQHNGFIYEASQAVIKYGFTALGFSKLYSYMTSSNIPSRCVAIRNNMHFEKTYLDEGIEHSVYSLSKEKWKSLQNRRPSNKMEKAILIGPPGAGKSYLSKQLAKMTNIPLYHLDMLFWKENWQNVSREEFIEIQNTITNTNKWIIDGSYVSTLEYRIEKCDTVIVMDFNIDECIANESIRRGTKRSDLPEFLEEKEDPEFIEYIKNYPNTEMKMLEAYLFANKHLNVIRLHNREETKIFLEKLR